MPFTLHPLRFHRLHGSWLAALVPATATDLRLAGPRALPGFWERLTWWQGGLALLLVVGLLGGAIWLWCRRRRRVEPPTLPWEWATAALADLERQDLRPPLYFTRLTDIVRTYCEQRYAVRAAEMTTPEFIRHLSQNPVVPETPRVLLAGLFEQADAVKFAQGQATPSQCHEALARARHLVCEFGNDPAAGIVPFCVGNGDQPPMDGAVHEDL